VERVRGTSGFTLIELVVTMTILGLMLLMIGGAMRLGSSSWARGEEKAETYQKRRIVFNLLSQQMKSSLPYKIKAQKAEADYLAFLGASDSLRFVSTYSLKAKRPEGLVFVIYQVEDGNSYGKVLRVYEKRVLNKDFMEETPDGDQFLTLLDGLSEIGFEYLEEGDEKESAGEWVESWDAKEKKMLPLQVRVVMKWKDKKSPEVTLPTLVSLPTRVYDDRKPGPGMIQRPGAPALQQPGTRTSRGIQPPVSR
jgi:general secretion pathway protein J